MEKVVLAGGCFWCMEEAFAKVTGVLSLEVGYIGPTEVIQILFDPEGVTFLQLLDIYWTHIDPLDPGGQFADRGNQYQTVIFVCNQQQRTLAIESKREVQALFNQPIATQIQEVGPFLRAEEGHQGYYCKQPGPFRRYQSGHLSHLDHLWKERKRRLYQTMLRDKLTPLQYLVTQKKGTEPPFNNPYWNLKKKGTYLDLITRDPLFSSDDKYDSGTGWPSFTKSLTQLVIKEDLEVISPYSGAHLGHRFPDGPPEKGGFRYCMNSAALFFIPSA